MQAEIWGPGTVMESPMTDGFVQLEGLIIRKTAAKWKGHGFKSLCRWQFQMLLNVFRLNSEWLLTEQGSYRLHPQLESKVNKLYVLHLFLLKHTFISVNLSDAG